MIVSARLIERARDESGMSLVEVMTSVAILLVVLGTFLTILSTLNDGLQVQQERSIAVDQARLAIERLDREIRSGNLFYDPAGESVPNHTFRLYTQSNAPTRTPSYQCVQYRINDSHQLTRRFWPSGEPQNVSSWSVVAEEIVNRDVDPEVPAFALDPDPAKGGRTVDVTLMVDVDIADTEQRTVRIQSSLTGRNTVFGFPIDSCTPAPAG